MSVMFILALVGGRTVWRNAIFTHKLQTRLMRVSLGIVITRNSCRDDVTSLADRKKRNDCNSFVVPSMAYHRRSTVFHLPYPTYRIL